MSKNAIISFLLHLELDPYKDIFDLQKSVIIENLKNKTQHMVSTITINHYSDSGSTSSITIAGLPGLINNAGDYFSTKNGYVFSFKKANLIISGKNIKFSISKKN